jgi:outer membrane lipoprotein carrier protein
MRRSLALALLSSCYFVAGAEAADEAAAARRLDAALGSLQGLRAEFRQTVVDASGRLTENAAGTVSLSRPGRFRWDYREPEQVIVSDGVTVWFYDVGLEQVTIRSAKDTINGTPARLLAGTGGLASEFEIADGGEREGLRWIRLTPRNEQTDFRELRVGLASGELRRMTMLDRLGQTTELEFERVERNPEFEGDTFRFTPPPGVDVVGREPAPAA